MPDESLEEELYRLIMMGDDKELYEILEAVKEHVDLT